MTPTTFAPEAPPVEVDLGHSIDPTQPAFDAEDVRTTASWLATHDPDGDEYDDPEYEPEAEDWRWDRDDLYVHDGCGV